MQYKSLLFLLVWPIITGQNKVAAQEHLGPLKYNRALTQLTPSHHPSTLKTTALSLPFFEDFTDYSLYPNPSKWADSNVYINNTMAQNPISRGVATFDALNKFGRPYDTINRYNLLFADSLTSRPFDLSIYSPQDSLYLSFFYQPQGMGFSPETADSLQLYFHKKQGGWALQWSVPGSEVQAFQQVLIPVADTNFLYNGFEFRFVNKASINTNDDVWNLDYIRLAANRSVYDTAIRDIAFTTQPSNYLNDYTAMPYRQFLANAANETNGAIKDSIWNHYSTNGTVNYGYYSKELATGTPLSTANNTTNFSPYSKNEINFSNFNNSISPSSNTARVVYQTSFYLSSGNPTEPKDNDSLVCEQIFDNYLAYDDGTAEKSYFLNLSPSLPGKIAVEYRLNVPDTLTGMAIYFGQQVPTAVNKEFSIAVFTALAGISGAAADINLYQQEQLYPLYTDEINHFTYYKFDSPVPLPKGVFYLSVIQPANSGSDSLYIGADVNRIGGNHVYYNVLNSWNSSLFSAALMMRPLLGGTVIGTSVAEQKHPDQSWDLYPNPSQNVLNINSSSAYLEYKIRSIDGREIVHSNCTTGKVNIQDLKPGTYLLSIRQNNTWTKAHKFIKQ